MSPSSHGGSPPDVGVLIPAAGRGQRAGSAEPKQFRPIAGVPMLLRSIRPFAQHPGVRQIVVALPPESWASPPAWLQEVMSDRLRIVAGGASRADSVAAALAVLDARCAVVLVHDAARPFVSPETIEAVISTAAAGVAAVAAVPVGDTIKRSEPHGLRVAQTVQRDGLWRAQTPQGFPRAMLEAAYRLPRTDAATDDAQLVEAAGFASVLVPDHSSNIKVTTADDFRLAEALAAR